MTKIISLLRGINVSGHNQIKMAGLKALYVSLKLNNPETYLQTGNVVYEVDPDGWETSGKKIEEKIRKDFGMEVSVVLRSAEQLGKIIQQNPFLKRKDTDIERLHVTFLSGEPGKVLTEKIRDIVSGRDEFIPAGKEIYLYCPDGYGRTKFSNTFFEKKLKVTATTRNWRTVLALYEMAR